jgi:hypothetical protein
LNVYVKKINKEGGKITYHEKAEGNWFEYLEKIEKQEEQISVPQSTEKKDKKDKQEILDALKEKKKCLIF